MNFLSLEYFLVVAEELNITKAAERLYISQQSLSGSIKKLERSLGVQLFTRTPSLALTYAGKRLVAAGTQIMNIKTQILNEMDDINNSRRGELRVGISHTRGRIVLPQILPEFRRTHPQIEITVVEGNSETLENKLEHGMIDLLFGFLPIMLEMVETVDILRERLFLVVPKSFTNHVFGEKSDFARGKFSESGDIVAFKDFPWLLLKEGNRIRGIMDSYFNHKGISPNIMLELENIETAFDLAAGGMGVTVYPEMFLKNINPDSAGLVDLFPLTNASTICTLAIGYSQKRYLTEAAKDFIKLASSRLTGIKA